MSKVIEIDRPAASAPIRDTELNVKSYNSYRYISKSGIILEASKEKPVYRYAKNYGKESVFSILMISQDGDTKKVESYMDKVAKLVNKSPNEAFRYIENEKYGGDK